jgi:hypothetical protein
MTPHADPVTAAPGLLLRPAGAEADISGVNARRIAATTFLAFVLSSASASAHTAIPRKWWIDEATALAKVRAHE